MARLTHAVLEAKVKRHQLRRYIRWLREWRQFARTRIEEGALGNHPIEVFRHSSVLIRDLDRAEQDLQFGKITNLQIAARCLDRLLIRPGEILSFWFTVGAPTRRRGFEDGLELRRRKLVPSVGGGLCQMSNLLYWMALHVDLDVIEHHRHGYDLFPDHRRRLPFGSGATVLYNYRDLQLRNTLDQPLVLRLRVGPEDLEGWFLAAQPLGFEVQLYETDHRFFARDACVWRANRLWRRVSDRGGPTVREELISSNVCEVLYDVPDELLQGDGAEGTTDRTLVGAEQSSTTGG